MSNEELYNLYSKGDIRAKEQLIIQNLGLIRHIAKRYYVAFELQKRCDINLDDLQQIGYFGLLKAIDKYNQAEGCKFTTYAFYWIKQSIRRSLEGHKETISLDAPIGEDDEDITLMDMVADENINIVEEVESKQLNAELKEVLKKVDLQQIEREYIRLKYELELPNEVIKARLGLIDKEYINLRDRTIYKLRRSPRIRQFKREWIEQQTIYLKAIDYSKPKVQTGYKISTVENIVLQRERLREAIN